MAQFNIIVDTELLKGLFSSNGKDQAFASLMESILNQVLNAQAAEQAGAQPYERCDGRMAYRNGYRDRVLKTRIGTITLSVPRLRNGDFSSELFQRYQRSEQALVITMMEMVINGVSTRKVSAVTEELCGTSFSKSTVSSLCEALDPIVDEFRNRPLMKRYPYIMTDAIYTKVREKNAIRSRGLLIAIGIGEDGTREVLGFQAADSESEVSWGEFFLSLKERGLEDVDLIVSDSHNGLVNAIRKHFQGAAWQRCQTHFSRNILDACPKRLQSDFKAMLKSLYEATDYDTAKMIRDNMAAKFQDKAMKSIEILDEGFEDALAVLNLPVAIRKRLRTSNGIERLNEEIRRRERVIRIFPNTDSLYRLIGALLIEIHDAWQSGRKYMDLSVNSSAIPDSQKELVNINQRVA